MKTMSFFVALLLLAPLASAQQNPQLPPLITTSGSAEVRVVPDAADLSFEVEFRHADLATARKKQSEAATKVLAGLRNGGVAEAELQSSQVRITPDYGDHRAESDKVRFFRVNQTISATLHDLKKVPDVTAEAVAAGATGVGEASLRTSELRKHRDEARAKAVRAAKEKAIALAGELGSKVGKPYSIVEGSGAAYGDLNSNSIQAAVFAADGERNAPAPMFAPGTLSVTATVTVSFILE